MTKIDHAKKLATTALDELSAALKGGKTESLKTYLEAMSHFHDYSFGNILLILSQNPEASRVAGYRTWQHFGRQVRKGEKGIVIIAPMLIRKGEENGPSSDDSSDSKFLRFRAAHVFDVAQTDGEPLPDHARVNGDPGAYTERLKAFVKKNGIVIEYGSTTMDADGLSKGTLIILRSGLSPAEEFSVLAHELAHELLHQKPGADRPEKTVRETEAEAVAFVVSRAIGLENGSASSDYIQLYRGSKETLAASLDRIQRTATAIIQAVTSSD
jgi:antirestriction protein ArdC